MKNLGVVVMKAAGICLKSGKIQGRPAFDLMYGHQFLDIQFSFKLDVFK